MNKFTTVLKKLNPLNPLSKIVDAIKTVAALRGPERQMLDDYLDLRLSDSDTFGIEQCGLHEIERIYHDEVEHPYTILYFQKGVSTYRAIVDVAQRAALRKTFKELDYENLCEYLNIPRKEIATCLVGTELLRQAYRDIYDWQREAATKQVVYTKGSIQPGNAGFQPTEVELPPATHWTHSPNELYQEVLYEDLPELTPEWEMVANAVRQADSSQDFVIKRPKKLSPRKACSSSLLNVRAVEHTVLVHPPYGEMGHFNFKIKDQFRATMRQTAKTMSHTPTRSIAIGPHIPAMLPRFDRRDAYTTLTGAAGRIGRLPVAPHLLDRNRMLPYIERAVDYVIERLTLAGLQPRNITSDDSFRWLASTKFPHNKKVAYLQAWSKVILPSGEFIPADKFSNTHKAFPKNESYLQGDKPQRMILSGDLQMAAVLAPACALLGNYFFSLDFTSKKIPEPERPRIAVDRFGTRSVILNDMSAWEGSIDEWTKNLIEHRILGHFFPNIKPWLLRANEPLHIELNGCKVDAPTMRCSGDPQTSLGNSLTNICSIIAAYLYSGPVNAHPADIVAWVEGDDSVVAIPPQWGEDYKAFYDRYHEAFIKMGYSTKMEISGFIGDAGYCSMFFDRALNLCPRVAQTFLDFPYDHSGAQHSGQEKLALKAISLDNTCGGQPLAWALARYYSPLHYMEADLPFNAYEYEEYIREGFEVQLNRSNIRVLVAPKICGREPNWKSRSLFYQKYGITPAKQVMLENNILKYGQIGLIMNSQGNRTWKYLEMLCVQDGIKLIDCKHMYNLAKNETMKLHPDCVARPNHDGYLEYIRRHPARREPASPPVFNKPQPINPYTVIYKRIRRERKKRRQLPLRDKLLMCLAGRTGIRKVVVVSATILPVMTSMATVLDIIHRGPAVITRN